MTKTTVNLSQWLESIRDRLINGELSDATEMRDKIRDAVLQGDTWLTSEEECLITSF